ncbi:NAD(P)/FAD-dependent oxidoreductase [Variovorax dokdonensis]|uniref:NAD(P)/FAD-dependent oxidoreductase n=1 Tax=Variovorax dokdonensis TaxID=344883 RepID=A0ABT7NG45_9BURK|nr:NAD(P)/FAD-dependent oxidoreductase [Variovorax dokdonensis]MDM0046908.1 NAD(P)/FAD-dependent oxidoreductase [Variovorax dokdonensis]
MKIVIVGAGVAGAILARRLALLPDVELHCLEKVGPDDHSEAGTGLNVGPNALKALRHVDPQLADDVERASLPWTRWDIALTDGTPLMALPLAQVADNPGIRIRWSELYRVLREGAGKTIHYGCTLESVARSATGEGRSLVRYTQGGQSKEIDGIDLLVGADGRYSKVRQMFSGAPEARHIGVAILRVLVPDTSAGLIDDYGQWFNGCHRLLAFRVPPGHVYIAATYPVEPGAPLRDEWKTESVMRATYQPAHQAPSAQVQWLLDALCANLDDAHWARMQESPIRYAEPDVDVLYVGDSAHGMAPTLGQGATQAMEDACAAALIIERAVEAGSRDVRQWLGRIGKAREARMRFVMDLSVRATDTMLEGGDPVAGTHWKTQPPFLAELSSLFREVALGDDVAQAT